MKPTPDIYLSISQEFPDEYIESVKKDLKAENLNLIVETTPSHIEYACLEWAVPTFISAYLFKSYFDGFLKEAGKDHYSSLKKWLTSNIKTLKPITVKTVVSAGADKKIDPTNTQSKVFSIQTRSIEGVTIKFLFDNQLSIEDWQAASISALTLMEDYFNNIENNELQEMISLAKPQAHMLFAIINPETSKWVFKPLKPH